MYSPSRTKALCQILPQRVLYQENAKHFPLSNSLKMNEIGPPLCVKRGGGTKCRRSCSTRYFFPHKRYFILQKMRSILIIFLIIPRIKHHSPTFKKSPPNNSPHFSDFLDSPLPSSTNLQQKSNKEIHHD
jgi:hypothetical protein